MSKRIKVLELIAGFSVEKPLGGIERFVIELSKNLDQKIFDPYVFGLWDFQTPYNHRWIQVLNEAGVGTYEGDCWDASHPYQSFIQSFRKLEKTIASYPVDIVHSHDQFGDVMAILLKQKYRSIRLVRTVHNQMEWHHRPLRKLFLRGFLYPLFYDTEIGVSQKIAADLDDRAGARVLRKKAHCIRNAVNPQRFIDVKVSAEEVRKLKNEVGIPADAFVVGTIGRLTEQKGYSDLIQAAEQVLQKESNIFFLIIGSGDLEDELRKQVITAGIADRVIFGGTRTDIERFIQTFNLFVSSSLWEGLPTVIMEAMAAGIPVVATNIPGSNDLLMDQVNGLLVPIGATSQLAQAILHAYHNPELCSKFLLRAKKELEKFSIQTIARQQESLYRDMMG